MNTKFQDIVDKAYQWKTHREPDGSVSYQMLSSHYTTRSDASFTQAELDALDVRLAPVIDAIYNANPQKTNGELVRLTLRYWSTPDIVIPPEAHTQHRDLQPYRTILFWDYEAPKILDKHVKIKFTDLVLKTTACGIKYVSNHEVRTAELDISWLDTAYPGWRMRYDMASDLGFDHTSATHQLFTNTMSTAPGVEISNIDFVVG